MSIFRKREKFVPAHLAPSGKEVEVEKEIKANFWNRTLMYLGKNGFIYVDPQAVDINCDAIMAIWYPH